MMRLQTLWRENVEAAVPRAAQLGPVRRCGNAWKEVHSLKDRACSPSD